MTCCIGLHCTAFINFAIICDAILYCTLLHCTTLYNTLYAILYYSLPYNTMTILHFTKSSHTISYHAISPHSKYMHRKERHHLTDLSLTSSFVVLHDRIEYVRIYSTSNKHYTDQNHTSNLAGIDSETKSNKPYQTHKILQWSTESLRLNKVNKFTTIRLILRFVAFVPEPLHLHLPAFFAHFPVPSELRISR